MIDKIIERMSDGAYKGANGTALLRLDMEEMRQQHTEMVDEIEDFELQVEELEDKLSKDRLIKKIESEFLTDEDEVIERFERVLDVGDVVDLAHELAIQIRK